MSHHQKLVKDDRTGKYVWVDARSYVPVDVAHKPAYSESRPLKSQSLAVPRHMVDKYNENYERAGLSVRHDRDGTISFSSKGQRNALMRHRGYMDLDAGYGDWAGR